jgi:pro-sigmaK processing inhibitor BofA
MSLLIEIATVLIALVILYILWKLLKLFAYLIVNSIIGILIFYLFNTYFAVGIPINLLSIGIVAIAGIPGVVLVLIIHYLGLGF